MEEIIDDSFVEPKKIAVPIQPEDKSTKKQSKQKKVKEDNNEENLVSCLRNTKVTVRFIPSNNPLWNNGKKHVLSGGMSENSTRILVVPKLSSGIYVNILTNSEKAFLEEFMGLEHDDLSVYKKKDNFWDDANPEGINKVILSKRDIYLDLSNPVDYIKYKILLANKNLVAPSMQAYEDMPKATYKYVLLEEDAEVKQANTRTSIKMECYKEFGKIEDDVDTMRFIIEVMEKRPYASDTKIEFLKSKIDELITTNAKMFLTIAKDEMLPTKILIKKSVENGVIVMRGNQYYLRDGSLPLCGNNEEPTLNIAARFLNLPKNQSIKLMLEAKLTD